MIIKELTIPTKVRKLEALLRRLPIHHPKRPDIESEWGRYMAGYRGEQALEYHLSFLPEQDYLILHNLRLPYGPHFFQMDLLLMSRRLTIIIEVKNYAGTLFFDTTFRQLIRTLNGKEEVFPDPILQVEHQRHQLKTFIPPDIPIESLVVFSNPSAILKTDGNSPITAKKVIRPPALQPKIEEFEKRYPAERITDKELRKLARQLIKKDTPDDTNLLHQFQLTKDELLTGVHCPVCQALPMKREYGTWVCPACSTSARDAHLSALKDYTHLISSDITNRQLRSFLHLPSTSSASKLLSSLNLPFSGSTKSRVYHLSKEQQKKAVFQKKTTFKL